MRYQPKHAAPRRSRTLAGVAVAGTAGLIAGLTTAVPASAQDGGVWDRVADCESGGNWSTSTGNGYYGGLQFYQPTWVGFGGQQYAAYAHQATRSQQVAVARKVLASQGPGAWPVCSVQAGLTRANGGASSTATAPASRPAPVPAPAPAPAASSPEPRQETSQPRQESSASRSSTSASASYTVRAGDTVSGLAKRFGTSTSAIVSANGLSNGGRLIYVGDRLSVPGASSSSSSTGGYTVTAGDTVSALAARYGTTVSAISSASNLSDPDFIVVGQTLSIPGA